MGLHSVSKLSAYCGYVRTHTTNLVPGRISKAYRFSKANSSGKAVHAKRLKISVATLNINIKCGQTENLGKTLNLVPRLESCQNKDQYWIQEHVFSIHHLFWPSETTTCHIQWVSAQLTTFLTTVKTKHWLGWVASKSLRRSSAW